MDTNNQARLSANADGFTSLISISVYAKLLNVSRDKVHTDFFFLSLLCNGHNVFIHGRQHGRYCLCIPNNCCAPRKGLVRLSIQLYQIKDKFIL